MYAYYKSDNLPHSHETQKQIQWREETLRAQPKGTEIIYRGPGSWNGRRFTKWADMSKKMECKNNTKHRRFMYKHLTCEAIEQAIDSYVLLTTGTTRLPF
jgi:hypothetical protein